MDGTFLKSLSEAKIGLYEHKNEASISMYKGMSELEHIADMYKAIGEELADIRSLSKDVITAMRSKGPDEAGKKFVNDDMDLVIASAENIIKTAREIQKAVKGLKTDKQE
jgi:phage-related protein